MPFPISPDRDSPFFKENRLERKQGAPHKAAEINRRVGLPARAAVRTRQLEHPLNQAAHLTCHYNDIFGKLRPRFRFFGVLEQLRVRQDDGKRRFQLVRCIRDELPLLCPGRRHRADRPTGQRNTKN